MAESAGGRAGVAVRDGLVWLLVAVCTVVGNGIDGEDAPPSWLTVLELVVLAFAVVLLRRRPLLGWLLVAVLALCVSPGMLSLAAALAVASCLLGRRSERTRPALLAFGGIALLGTVGVLVEVGQGVRYADPVFGWLMMVGTLLFVAVFPWLVGRYRCQDRELVRAGWERAERLEHEQRIVAAQAGLRERARIAEDMHDALGHDLSLIALRAGALQVAPDLPDAHRAAVAELRAQAAAATDRLHEIIGVLRERTLPESEFESESEPGPGPLAPVGEPLRALVERAVSSGLRARLVTVGGPEEERPGSGTLPPAVDRAAYRVVQEGLTNAAKHAPGAEVTVTVRAACPEGARPGAVARVSVANGPSPVRPTEQCAPERTVAGRAGTGLIALRERVRVAGGGLSAVARDDGGFVVTAWFPADRVNGAGGSDGAGAPAASAGAGAGQSAAVRQFARARQVARRRIAVASACAGTAAALVTVAVLGWYAYTTAESVLPVAAYDRLRVGDPEARVRAGLPGREDVGPPVDRAPALPHRADCAYYRSSGDLFTSVDIYRLCFRDGRLISKNVIERAGAER
ncbi:sensor histidine kinase [Streptomyces gossypii]|uniref:sensor histidine kinase n=1 Tax=Streptomyces gossypii TaxID=2883101 RepID=UPI0028833AE9|nr:histidine kinase [Streptomyces gossypii]